MIVEAGDLFVVERGFELNIKDTKMDASGITATTVRNHFDRSDLGLVFRALEVVNVTIACEVVYSAVSYKDKVGTKRIINTSEVEVMVVPESFLQALQGESK